MEKPDPSTVVALDVSDHPKAAAVLQAEHEAPADKTTSIDRRQVRIVNEGSGLTRRQA